MAGGGAACGFAHCARSSTAAGGTVNVDALLATRFSPSRKVPPPKFMSRPKRQIEELEIGQHLPRMDGRKPVDRLDFDDQPPLDEEIGPEGLAHGNSVIFDIDDLLPFHGQAGAGEAGSEQSLVARIRAGPARGPGGSRTRIGSPACASSSTSDMVLSRRDAEGVRDLQISTQRRKDAKMHAAGRKESPASSSAQRSCNHGVILRSMQKPHGLGERHGIFASLRLCVEK